MHVIQNKVTPAFQRCLNRLEMFKADWLWCAAATIHVETQPTGCWISFRVGNHQHSWHCLDAFHADWRVGMMGVCLTLAFVSSEKRIIIIKKNNKKKIKERRKLMKISGLRDLPRWSHHCSNRDWQRLFRAANYQSFNRFIHVLSSVMALQPERPLLPPPSTNQLIWCRARLNWFEVKAALLLSFSAANCRFSDWLCHTGAEKENGPANRPKKPV